MTGLCEDCIKEINTDKIGAGACYYICDKCSISDVTIYLEEKRAVRVTKQIEELRHRIENGGDTRNVLYDFLCLVEKWLS